MTRSTSVPPEVLAGSMESRLAYFRSVIVSHPNLDNALERLDAMSSSFLPQRLVLVVGAAGVGKTALLHKLVSTRLAARQVAMASDATCFPAFYYELEPPTSGAFTFLPFYRGALSLMNAVAIDKTIPFLDWSNGQPPNVSSLLRPHAWNESGEKLKVRFRENLVQRRVEIAALDEAIFAFRVGAESRPAEYERRILNQAALLRSFVNTTPTTFVLAGAYEFFSLTVNSSQLARRSSIVHLEPYLADEKGVKAFVAALTQLLDHLPVDHDIDLNAHATELLVQSLGCIGILKDILTKALSAALRKQCALNHELLKASYLPVPALARIRADLQSGMASMQMFLSCDDMADLVSPNIPSTAPRRPPGKGKSPALKPGDMAPSYRRDATTDWGSE